MTDFNETHNLYSRYGASSLALYSPKEIQLKCVSIYEGEADGAQPNTRRLVSLMGFRLSIVSRNNVYTYIVCAKRGVCLCAWPSDKYVL